MTDRCYPLFAHFSHHRCATSWIWFIVRDVCALLGLNAAYVFHPRNFDFDIGRYIENNDIDFLSYVNANYLYVRQLTNFKGFHVIRDPRDLCVSAYFSHRYSHGTDKWPELVAHRANLENCSKEEGLLLDMDFLNSETSGLPNVFQSMRHWNYNQPNVLELKIEDMADAPLRYFTFIFQYLGILPDCVSHSDLADILSRYEFAKLAEGRSRGQSNPEHHYRKGVAGDWRNHFTKRHISYFNYKFGDIVSKLGYEL